MKTRTLTDLIRFLDEELSWRKKELTTLKFLLGGRQDREDVLLLRAGVCVLYAHWEGFVKAVATRYVSFVASRGLRYSDLSPNFVALGFRPKIVVAGQSKKPTAHTELTKSFLSDLSEVANLDWRNAVGTRSNLNSEVLTEILCLLGLDEKGYLLKKQLLDQRLVQKRNLIAHGKRVEIQAEDYNELHDEMIQLLQKFRTDVEDAAATKTYRI